MRCSSFVWGIVLVSMTSLALADGSPVDGQRPKFMVFDGLLYQGKPDSRTLGMTLVRGINPPSNNADLAGDVVESDTRFTFTSLADFEGLVYLDYEQWALAGVSAQAAADHVAKLTRVIEIAHQTMPKAKIGYYDVIPCGEYWALINHDPQLMQRWLDCNRRGEAVAAHVDVVFPSLYTFYFDQDGWDTYAAGQLKQAHRYGKPVYAFLWPEFHVSNRLLKGTNLPAAMWRHELEFCSTRADGIVIWGGWQKKWDEQAPWWIETKAFLERIHRE